MSPAPTTPASRSTRPSFGVLDASPSLVGGPTRAKAAETGKTLRSVRATLDALVDDDDVGELLVAVTEVLTGALLKLVGPEELARQVDGWLDERRERLAG
jgi:hypothetical protein